MFFVQTKSLSSPYAWPETSVAHRCDAQRSTRTKDTIGFSYEGLINTNLQPGGREVLVTPHAQRTVCNGKTFPACTTPGEFKTRVARDVMM